VARGRILGSPWRAQLIRSLAAVSRQPLQLRMLVADARADRAWAAHHVVRLRFFALDYLTHRAVVGLPTKVLPKCGTWNLLLRQLPEQV
jgi:hypothetical protein